MAIVFNVTFNNISAIS